MKPCDGLRLDFNVNYFNCFEYFNVLGLLIRFDFKKNWISEGF